MFILRCKMKKIVVLIMFIGIAFFGNTVFAKDVVYSFNKYHEEKLDYILKDPTGFVMAGTFEKKDQDVQVILLKYKTDGRLEWKYSYGENKEDQLYGFTYLYDENHNVNGYVLVVEDTTNEEKETNPQFLLVDLEGKLIRKQDSFLDSNTEIYKIEMIENEGVLEGYLLVGAENQKGMISKYDKDFNLIWNHSYEEENTTIIDAISISNMGYYVILSTKVDEKDSYSLCKFDDSSSSFSILKDDFEVNMKPHLEKAKDSYLVYGVTNDVKLSNNQVGSYYLMKYNKEDQEEWETVGNTSVDEQKVLKVHAIENNQKTEYYILSVNRADNSFEVIRADQDGLLQEKVKKLKNDYYDIQDFLFSDSSLYFVGQMNCPEEDNCDYDEKSLFLACTEDKVIEVKDFNIGYFLVGIFVLAGGMVVLYLVRKRKVLKEKKR